MKLERQLGARGTGGGGGGGAGAGLGGVTQVVEPNRHWSCG